MSGWVWTQLAAFVVMRDRVLGSALQLPLAGQGSCVECDGMLKG